MDKNSKNQLYFAHLNLNQIYRRYTRNFICVQPQISTSKYLPTH